MTTTPEVMRPLYVCHDGHVVYAAPDQYRCPTVIEIDPFERCGSRWLLGPVVPAEAVESLREAAAWLLSVIEDWADWADTPADEQGYPPSHSASMAPLLVRLEALGLVPPFEKEPYDNELNERLLAEEAAS